MFTLNLNSKGAFLAGTLGGAALVFGLIAVVASFTSNASVAKVEAAVYYGSCGPGEYSLTCGALDGAKCHSSDLNGSNACCKDWTDCVYKNRCYSLRSKVKTSDRSRDYEVCDSYEAHDLPGRWYDQDRESSVCKSHWIDDPDACKNAGPYKVCDDQGSGDPNKGFCCGDDRNERYVRKDCNGNTVNFCCPSRYKYVSNGKCAYSCPRVEY